MRELTDSEKENISYLERLADREESEEHNDLAASLREQASGIKRNLEHDEDETVLHHRESDAFSYLYDKEKGCWRQGVKGKLKPYKIQIRGKWQTGADLYKISEDNEFAVHLRAMRTRGITSQRLKKHNVLVKVDSGRERTSEGVRFGVFILDRTIADSQAPIPYLNIRVCDLWDFALDEARKNIVGNAEKMRFDEST